jgi:hypothetical protein
LAVRLLDPSHISPARIFLDVQNFKHSGMMMFWDQVGDYISADFLKLCNCGDLFMFQEYSGHCSSQELMTA